MSFHFQVVADFELSEGKPSLVSTVLYSTHAAITSIPFYPYPSTYLSISRIFPTLQLARSYVAYLQRVYPDSFVPLPILDSGQQELFQEVSE